MWWEYLRRAYTGEIEPRGWNPRPGEEAFAEVFKLESGDDWKRLNEKLEAFLLALSPDDSHTAPQAD
jgi:hypothetical protein